MKKVQTENYAIINKETGEIVADNAMFIGREAFMDKGFRKVFVGFLRDIVIDKDIAGKAIRLLLYIIENLKPNDLTILLYWKVVCEELEITQGTYYSWLNILLEKGIIERTEIPNMYKIVPYSAVNGQMQTAINKNLKNTKNNKKEI